VFVGTDHQRLRLWSCDGESGGHVELDGARIGAAVVRFERLATPALRVGHASLASQPRQRKAIDEVARGADGQVKVEGMVLAVGKALEAVDDKGLDELRGWAEMGEEQERMSAEAGGEPHNGGMGTAGFAGNLTESRAREQAVKHGLEQLGTLEEVGGGEGLRTEGSAAMATAEARNDLRFTLPGVGAEVNPTPPEGGTVVATTRSWAERGDESP
jgi:hypothetical protein